MLPTVDPNVLMAIASTKQTKVLFAEEMAKSQGKPCFESDHNMHLSLYQLNDSQDVIGRQQDIVERQSSELKALRFSLHNLQVEREG